MEQAQVQGQYPVLAIHDLVIFPEQYFTCTVMLPRSLHAIRLAVAREDRCLIAVALDEDEQGERISAVGTVAEVGEVDETGEQCTVALRGVHRVTIADLVTDDVCLFATGEPIDETPAKPEEVALLRAMAQELAQAAREDFGLSPEFIELIAEMTDPGCLADALAIKLFENDPLARRELLAVGDPGARLDRIVRHIHRHRNERQLKDEIESRVKTQIDKQQREYYLREQLKAIKEALDGGDTQELEALGRTIREQGLPEEVEEKALKELRRLERMSASAPEAPIIRTYIEWLLALPWTERTDDAIDLAAAEATLERDHYGIERVKERIIEFLAVRQLTKGQPDQPTTILCFAGPPGVGKTSLGQSIATAMGRRFVRISLGGVHDEAEIRGHRRTYIGAMPGQIVQMLRKVGVRNPVILLDEIDKLGADQRGDPASSLLEVLDPEQNRAFRDHYLELTFDLSEVFFITTANYLGSVPRPLRDRMEVVELSSYTEEEKMAIGRRYLFPRQLRAHGLGEERIALPDRTMRSLIQGYTREAGVRDLDRQIAALCRKTARAVAKGEAPAPKVTSGRLVEFLGKPRYHRQRRADADQVGVATGLGWSELGGSILPVEVVPLGGSGRVTITGHLGQVMEESARTALSYVKSRAADLGIDQDYLDRHDLHIHVPEGAVPKDGPSAGITIATAIISVLTGRPIAADLAMTGEVTLRGRVLAIGGLKEKVLAAHRSGIRTVLFPIDNLEDLDELPRSVRRELRLEPVRTMDDVIPLALRDPIGPPPAPAPVAPVARTADAVEVGSTIDPGDQAADPADQAAPLGRDSADGADGAEGATARMDPPAPTPASPPSALDPAPARPAPPVAPAYDSTAPTTSGPG